MPTGQGLEAQEPTERESQSRNQRLLRAIKLVFEGNKGELGEAFLDMLTRQLARVLDADVTIAGELIGGREGLVHAVSVHTHGRRGTPYWYSIANTPCEIVTKHGSCAYAYGIAEQFPCDSRLSDGGIDGYVGTALKDTQGKTIGLLVALFQKRVSDPEFAMEALGYFATRASLEIQRMRADALIATRDDALRCLMDSDVIGIVIAQADGLVLDANNAFLNIVGYSAEEMRRGLLRWDELPSPDPRARDAASSECSPGAALSREKEYVRRDGTRVPVLIGGTLVDKPRARVIAFVLDQTERKTADRVRADLLARERAARTEAQEANRAKDHFLAVLSHELRNPLAPILSATHMLHQLIPAERKAERTLSIIERNVRHQARLINDLLDLSRIERGVVELDRMPLDFGTLVEDILVASAQPACAAGVSLTSHLDPGVVVDADSTRLREILLNLLSNAFKHTPPGGRVEVHLSRENNMARLLVSDTGAGITEERLVTIFEPFAGPNSGGSGIGLSIVRALVKLHGGRVWADSGGLGKGSRFGVEIPLAGTAKDRPDTGPAAERQKANLLLVEDNVDLREVLTQALDLIGYTVTSCATGEEALAFLATHVPDCIIADIGLPGIDGYSLLRHVRSTPELAKVPAIAASAYGQPSDVLRARHAGFDAHVVKPYDVDELSDRIEELAHGRDKSS